MSAPVDKFSFNGYVSSTPKSKLTAEIDIRLNPWKKQSIIDITYILNFIRMQVNPEKIALAAHINIVTNLYLLVFCKNVPTKIDPTTPPPMNTAPK